MSDSDHLPSSKPPLRSPRQITVTLDMGRPLVIILWALFVFVAGAITGASLLLLSGPPPHHGPPPGEMLGGTGLPRNFAQRMQRDHGLTPEQTQAIEAIVEKYQPRLEETSRAARTKLRSELEQMNDEILPLLTPNQRRAHMERFQHVIDSPDRPPPPHGPRR